MLNQHGPDFPPFCFIFHVVMLMMLVDMGALDSAFPVRLRGLIFWHADVGSKVRGRSILLTKQNETMKCRFRAVVELAFTNFGKMMLVGLDACQCIHQLSHGMLGQDFVRLSLTQGSMHEGNSS